MQHGYQMEDDDGMMEGHDDDEEEEDDDQAAGVQGIVGRGNGIGFFAEGDEDEGTYVEFKENADQLQ